MSAPVISWPGILAPLSIRVVRTPGTSPNIFQLEITPQAPTFADRGDLSISFEDSHVVFRDCLIDQKSIQFNELNQVVSVLIFDRRWKWKFGQISGYWNLTTRTGIKPSAPRGIRRGREPIRLLRDCFRALDEDPDDVIFTDELPDIKPELNWDFSAPSLELARLCKILQCRVILRLDNKIEVVSVGTGDGDPLMTKERQEYLDREYGVSPEERKRRRQQRAQERAELRRRRIAERKKPPPIPPVLRISAGTDTEPKPERIYVVTAPVVYQADLILEPVGEDIDGSIKRLDELSIKPQSQRKRRNGWFYEEGGWTQFLDDQIMDPEDEFVKQASKSVWRWFRPIPGFSVGPTSIESLEQLHVLNQQIRAVLQDGRLVSQPAIVYGSFWDEVKQLRTSDNTEQFTVAELVNRDLGGSSRRTRLTQPNALPETFKEDDDRIINGWSWDEGTKTVRFGRPIYDVDGVTYQLAIYPGLIFRTAFEVREEFSFSFVRHLHVRRLKQGAKLEPSLYVTRNDLVPRIRTVYGDAPPHRAEKTFDTNNEQIRENAQEILKAVHISLENRDSSFMEVAGIWQIELSGDIDMITYEIDLRSGVRTGIYQGQSIQKFGNLSLEAIEIRQQQNWHVQEIYKAITATQRQRQIDRERVE